MDQFNYEIPITEQGLESIQPGGQSLYRCMHEDGHTVLIYDNESNLVMGPIDLNAIDRGIKFVVKIEENRYAYYDLEKLHQEGRKVNFEVSFFMDGSGSP